MNIQQITADVMREHLGSYNQRLRGVGLPFNGVAPGAPPTGEPLSAVALTLPLQGQQQIGSTPMMGMAGGGTTLGLIPGKVNPAVADDTTITTPSGITMNAKKGEYVVPQEVVAAMGTDFFDNLVMKTKKKLGLPMGTGPKTHDMPDSMGRMDAPGLPMVMGMADGGTDLYFGQEDKYPLTDQFNAIKVKNTNGFPLQSSNIDTPLTDQFNEIKVKSAMPTLGFSPADETIQQNKSELIAGRGKKPVRSKGSGYKLLSSVPDTNLSSLETPVIGRHDNQTKPIASSPIIDMNYAEVDGKRIYSPGGETRLGLQTTTDGKQVNVLPFEQQLQPISQGGYVATNTRPDGFTDYGDTSGNIARLAPMQALPDNNPSIAGILAQARGRKLGLNDAQIRGLDSESLARPQRIRIEQDVANNTADHYKQQAAYQNGILTDVHKSEINKNEALGKLEDAKAEALRDGGTLHKGGVSEGGQQIVINNKGMSFIQSADGSLEPYAGKVMHGSGGANINMNKLSDAEQAAINIAVSEKRLDPYKINGRNQKVLAGIEMAHPGTDLNNISAGLGVARNKDVITKAGIAGMLPELMAGVVKSGKDLNYSDTQFIGKIQQFAKGQLNDPKLAEHMTQRNDLILTLGGVMRANGMTDMAQRLEEDAAPKTMSPKAFDGWIKGQMAAVAPRIKMYESLTSGHGLPGKTLGIEPSQQPARQVMSALPPASAHKGKVITGSDGSRRQSDGTKWVRL